MLKDGQEVKATETIWAIHQIALVLKNTISVIKEVGEFGRRGPTIVQLEGYPDNAWFYAEFFSPLMA